MNNVFLAFALTLIAGLSTGIGSCIAFFAKHTNRKFLSISLGFSAGVMIYVSMIEIFVKAQDSLVSELGKIAGNWVTVGSFFGGMLVIAIIDKLIPSEENPHELKSVEDENKKPPKHSKLMRMGVFTALAIAIHNFPEGLATFVSAMQEPSVAIPIVVAIAIHNIPEGIAVSVPIYQATGSKMKAFLYSFLSIASVRDPDLPFIVFLSDCSSRAKIFQVVFPYVAAAAADFTADFPHLSYLTDPLFSNRLNYTIFMIFLQQRSYI